MIVLPRLPEDGAFIVELASQVIAQVTEPLLELLLESVEDVVNVSHSLHSLLLILLNFAVRSK